MAGLFEFRPFQSQGARHVNLDGDAAGVFEDQGHREWFARFERRGKAHQHDVQAAGLEDGGFPGGDFDRLDRAHFNDAVFEQVRVRLGMLGRRRGDRDETIGRWPKIDDGEIRRPAFA